MSEFTIQQKEGITIFTNETPFYIEVSLIPIRPRRKYIDIAVITPGKRLVHGGYCLDLTKLSFRFVKREEALCGQ
jgi:hypothetical protein